MLGELRSAGIDTGDFGSFGRAAPAPFGHADAAPILLRWLPQIDDTRVRESIVRSLTEEPVARELGAARVLVGEFPRSSDDDSTRWAIGNALATLADASVADDVIRLLRDRRYGAARQMLCDALKRTGDPRAPAVLVELIDDDEVAGHAVSALRSYGPRKAVPLLREAKPRLEALAARSTATAFAHTQAERALAQVAAAG